MTVFTTFLAWFGGRQIERIDVLEKEKAAAAAVKSDFDDVKDMITNLTTRSDERHDENTKRLDRILENMATQNTYGNPKNNHRY